MSDATSTPEVFPVLQHHGFAAYADNCVSPFNRRCKLPRTPKCILANRSVFDNRYPKEIQRDNHLKTIKPNREIPRISIATNLVARLLCLPNSQTYQNGILDNGVDERGRNALMLARHSIAENDGARRERHIHSQRHNQEGNECLRPILLADWSVARMIWLVRQQAMAATMMYATLTFDSRKPSARDSSKPLGTTGICCAAEDRTLWFRRCSTNC